MKHHFVVPESFNEKKSVDQLRVIYRKLHRHKYITGYTIYPTLQCNARCFYCFENNFVKQTMTTETADKVVAYILEHSGGNGIQITWFGGEPLVGKPIIDYICRRLTENDKHFSSSMVSNAYLFDEQVVKTAVEQWHLKSIQITLDGTEEVYNRSKAYVNPVGSPYERVLKNIRLLADAGVSVAVRLNITEDNIDNLHQLADELKVKFSGVKGVQVYGHLVYDKVGYAPIEYAEGSEDRLYLASVQLQDQLVAAGLSYGVHKLPEFKFIHCMSDGDEGITVFPDGRIGKCENSSPDDAFGHIDGNVFPDKLQLAHEYSHHELCNHCALYPHCVHLVVCP